MSIEERNDRVEQITPSSDHELDEVLTMIVVAAVREEPAHPEELSELLEASNTYALPVSRQMRETPGSRCDSPVAQPGRAA